MSSPAARIKQLHLFAGPDGSGKSSIYRAVMAQHTLGAYVNSDELQLELVTPQGVLLRRFLPSLDGRDLDAFYAQHPLPLRLSFGEGSPYLVSADARVTLLLTARDSQNVSCAASVLADYLRTRLIGAGVLFSSESVLAHPSELTWVGQAKKKGYRIALYYVCVASPVICKQRVAVRVKHGGHGVPEAKVVEGYGRSLALLKEAVALSDQAYLFDNSYSGAALKLEILNASDVIAHEPQLPEWITRNLPPLVPHA